MYGSVSGETLHRYLCWKTSSARNLCQLPAGQDKTTGHPDRLCPPDGCLEDATYMMWIPTAWLTLQVALRITDDM